MKRSLKDKSLLNKNTVFCRSEMKEFTNEIFNYGSQCFYIQWARMRSGFENDIVNGKD